MSALDILEAAAGHMKDRAATYDKPAGERSMGATVAAFKAITGISMTEEQGWLFMGVLKQVRTQQGGWRADNYEDGAAYFALQGEAAERDRGQASNDGFAMPCDNTCSEAIHAEPSTEDMTDPSNWRAGDWVERIVDENRNVYEKGRIYQVKDVGERSVRIYDDYGVGSHCAHCVGDVEERFRFHARPDAEGWIKWEGGERPVNGDVEVEIRTADGMEEDGPARAFEWRIDNAGHDIIAYRPHLATKHDKG